MALIIIQVLPSSGSRTSRIGSRPTCLFIAIIRIKPEPDESVERKRGLESVPSKGGWSWRHALLCKSVSGLRVSVLSSQGLEPGAARGDQFPSSQFWEVLLGGCSWFGDVFSLYTFPSLLMICQEAKLSRPAMFFVLHSSLISLAGV